MNEIKRWAVFFVMGLTLWATADRGFAEDNPLVAFITDDTVALLLAKPQSLIEDTEQEVLGNLPYLNQFPVPPSEIEQLAVLVRMHPNGEPAIAIGFQFRRAVPQVTLKRWLAPQAVLLPEPASAAWFATPDTAMPSMFGRPHLVLPTPQTAWLSPDPLLLEQLLAQATHGSARGTLAREVADLDSAVNLACLIDVEQIRMFAEGALLDDRSEFTQSLRAIPQDLSTLGLEASFGKRTNRLRLRFTKSDSAADSPQVEAWSRRVGPHLQTLFDIPIGKLKSDLPDELDREIDTLVSDFGSFWTGFEPAESAAAESGRAESGPVVVMQSVHPPSFSRVLMHASKGLRVMVLIARDAARRMQQSNHIKQVLLAWHNYHDGTQKFPQDIVDADGKPLLSWRVRILPMLQQQALYDQFHLDEPWDSEHNRALLANMPSVYRDAWNENGQSASTRVQRVTGLGTLADGSHGFGDVTDGTSNTAALIDASQPVEWTRPADVDLSDGMQQKLRFRGSTSQIGMLDGHVSQVIALSDDMYRRLFCIADGMIMDIDSPEPVEAVDESAASAQLADIPGLLTELQSQDPAIVRDAALTLLVNRDRFDDAGRHPLTRIGLGLWNYYETFGEFPRDIRSPDGTPLLSWRVQILPFIEQRSLYEQFQLDQPWDSETNKALIAKMPEAFGIPATQPPAGRTRFVAVVGAGTIFGDQAKLADIVDGTSGTGMLVEAAEAVIWTKPHDLALQESFADQLQRTATGRHVILMADGAAVEVPSQNAAAYRQGFSYNDNAVLDASDVSLAKVPVPERDAVLPIAKRLLDAPNANVRVWGVRLYAMYSRGAPLDGDLFRQLLHDPNREIRRYVLSQLAFRESTESVNLLFELGGGDEAIVDGILRNPLSSVAADGLVTRWDALDDSQRRRALSIIGDTGNSSHLPMLSALLSDPKYSAAAQRAIETIQTADPPPLDAEQQVQHEQKMLRRGQLWQQGQQLIKEKRYDEMFVAIKQMLDLEREIYGDTHQEVFDTIQWLMQNYVALGRSAETAELAKLRADLLQQQLGPEHIRTKNALADVQSHTQQAALSEPQQQRYAEAKQLEAQAVKQQTDKQLPEALASIEQALRLRTELFGKDSVLLLPPLRFQRQLYFDAKQNHQARDVAAEVVRIISALIGPDAPTTQEDRTELAYLSLLLGDVDVAVEQLLELQRLPTTDETAARVARDARFLAGKLTARAQTDEAAALLLKSLRLRDDLNRQADAGETCIALATMIDHADPAAAYAWRTESLWRYQQENPYQGFWSNYPPLADAMHASGKLHLELSLRKALVDVLRQGVEAKQVGLLQYAQALTGSYIAIGDYGLAEETLAECKRIVGEYRGDPFVITFLTHQARVREYFGDPSGAESLLLEALRLSKQDNAAFLQHAPAAFRRLAALYVDADQPAQALPFLETVRTATADQPTLERLCASVLLGRALLKLDRVADAKQIAQTASDELDGVSLSAEERIEVQGQLSRLWLSLHEPARAETLALAAQQQVRGEWGTETHRYTEITSLLAEIQLALERPDEAMQTALQALQQARQLAEQSAYLLSPRQQLAFTQTMRKSLDSYLSLAITRPDSADASFAEIFRWKGSALVRQRTIHQLANEEGVAPFYQQLGSITRQLSTVSRQAGAPATGADPTESEQSRLLNQNLETLTKIKDLLEGQLSSARLAYLDWEAPSTVQEFVAALPADGVFVDFLVFQRTPLVADGSAYRCLLATVIDHEGQFSVHDLGDMQAIEADIEAWRQSLGDSADSRRAGERLRSKLWVPLVDRIADADTVLISPDDALGRLPFHALPSGTEGRYLIEEFRIAVVPVPQLLPELQQRRPQPTNAELLLVGDVQYDQHAVEPSAADAVDATSLGTRSRALRQGTHFNALPGTREEIVALQRLFKAAQPDAAADALLTLAESQASEQAFREASRRFANIHVATHGFFAPAGVNVFQQQGIQAFNPGLLSGLVFAGANQPVDRDADDGILSAEEIATLEMEHVDLAVLSACETGLGRVAGGEGLIGIQRSFQVAGVDTTVTSLWQVPDQATRILMERFYRNYWLKDMSKLDALREAQIFMLRTPEVIQDPKLVRGDARIRPAARPQGNNQLSPRSWAAFVLSGDWR